MTELLAFVANIPPGTLCNHVPDMSCLAAPGRVVWYISTIFEGEPQMPEFFTVCTECGETMGFQANLNCPGCLAGVELVGIYDYNGRGPKPEWLQQNPWLDFGRRNPDIKQVRLYRCPNCGFRTGVLNSIAQSLTLAG